MRTEPCREKEKGRKSVRIWSCTRNCFKAFFSFGPVRHESAGRIAYHDGQTDKTDISTGGERGEIEKRSDRMSVLFGSHRKTRKKKAKARSFMEGACSKEGQVTYTAAVDMLRV